MATAVFTTVEARVDQTLTNAIWADEIKDNLNQLASAHRNLLTNGGFEVWQRGAGTFSTGGTYAADRWVSNVGSTFAIDREATIVEAGSQYSLKFAVTVFAGSASVSQGLNDLAYAARGQTLSFSCRVRQDTASRITLQITDSSGTTTGAASATTGAFVTLTATRAIDAAATSLQVTIVSNGTGTFYFDNAMLVIGPAPAPYRPLHPQEELARCQRYYQILGGAASTLMVEGYGAAGATNGNLIVYPVPMGGLPTVTKNGTWGVVNCGQPSGAFTSASSVTLRTTVTALGSYQFSCNSTDDNLTLEWNP